LQRNKLLLATTNKGKAREYKALLRGVPYEITTMFEQGLLIDIEESGISFEENAWLKATTLATASGLLSLADDSGLEVDALGGEPGVNSARFAGAGASDEDRYRLLLEKLKDVPEEKRSAHFRCAIAIASPDGKVEICSGECPGIITREPRGENGFGYDPVFYIPDLNKTMAELTSREKNRVSHRARAAKKAKEVLVKIARSW
jgi:XTP/dITP diphosphohydrolase